MLCCLLFFLFVSWFLSWTSRLYSQDPCVARREYVEELGVQYSTACNSLLTAKNEYLNAQTAINTTIQLIRAMETCCGSFPYQHLDLSVFTDGSDGHKSIMETYGFEYTESSTICGGSGCECFVLLMFYIVMNLSQGCAFNSNTMLRSCVIWFRLSTNGGSSPFPR